MEEVVFRFGGTELALGQRTLLMGILNVTPDSFSDGGLYSTGEAAVRRGCAMAEEGADIIDVGGESTRPGAPAVDDEEEARRIVPVIRELSRRITTPISADTSKAEVARRSVDAGAAIINDVSGLRRDPEMAETVRDTGAGVVVMHMRGLPTTMQQTTDYEDLTEEIRQYFIDSIRTASQAGIPEEQLMLDPGIGFSKKPEDNYVLIRSIPAFRSLGRPILMGPSRKSFIGRVLPELGPGERIWGTAAAVAGCCLFGADVVRVHDVAEMRQVMAVSDAVRNLGGTAVPP